MKIPDDLSYTKSHEWVRYEDNRARIGITDHAQAELGDVVFVEAPQPGDTVTMNQSFGSIESVKAVSDLYAPLSGQVVEVNDEWVDNWELINKDPYGRGWLILIEMSDERERENLLSPAEYAEAIQQDEH